MAGLNPTNIGTAALNQQIAALTAQAQGLAGGGGAAAPAAGTTAAPAPGAAPAAGTPGAAGTLTEFQKANALMWNVNLDTSVGLNTGIINLGRIVAARSERVKALTQALTVDASKPGAAMNLADAQLLQLESTTTQQLSELQKAIQDKQEQSIRRWLQ